MIQNIPKVDIGNAKPAKNRSDRIAKNTHGKELILTLEKTLLSYFP